VIHALEKLKGEAAEVATEMAQTEEVMAEVERVSALYEPLAVACSKIYFSLEQLGGLHFLYQYSLQFFLDAVSAVLKGGKAGGGAGAADAPPAAAGNAADDKEATDRMTRLTATFFKEIVARVSRGLLQSDKLMFALQLAQIRLRGRVDGPSDAEMTLLLRGGASSAAAVAPDLLAPVSQALVVTAYSNALWFQAPPNLTAHVRKTIVVC
jgi:dynein heavy chain 1